jgi:hypothetical protein
LSRYLAEGVYADPAQEYLREIAKAETELAKIEKEAKGSLPYGGRNSSLFTRRRLENHSRVRLDPDDAIGDRFDPGHVFRGDVDRLKAILHDLVLRAPRSGRVQYKLMRAGEVVAAGTHVLTILDLGDVYMTIFLPAAVDMPQRP